MLEVVNGTALGRAVEPEVKKTPMILSLDGGGGGGECVFVDDGIGVGM